jgi:hypothetical protein
VTGVNWVMPRFDTTRYRCIPHREHDCGKTVKVADLRGTWKSAQNDSCHRSDTTYQFALFQNRKHIPRCDDATDATHSFLLLTRGIRKIEYRNRYRSDASHCRLHFSPDPSSTSSVGSMTSRLIRIIRFEPLPGVLKVSTLMPS